MKRILYILILSLLIFGCNRRMTYQNPVLISVSDTAVWSMENNDNIETEDIVSAYIDYDDYEREKLLYEKILKEEELRERSSKNYSSPLLMENKGTLVYKVDSVLIIDVVSRVEARIIELVSDETTIHLVSLTSHTSTGIIYEEVIRVGNIMDMELKSLELDAFTIHKITSDEQLVDEKEVTQWLWSVTANKVGDYSLIMTAKIKDGASRDVIIFDKQISVMNKPKKKYSVTFTYPDIIKRYNENTIGLDLVEDSDDYSFEWGGEGKVVIHFGGNVIVMSDENIINDDKRSFNYRWSIKPEGKEKVIPFVIEIIGDYEDLIIFNGELIVEKNFKESFNKFIDGAVKRWYWLFTALLIPLFGFIRKKYLTKKIKQIGK